MNFQTQSRSLLESLADSSFSALLPGEELSLNLTAEEQHYIRFNQTKVRQSTEVMQRRLSLTFQAEGRRFTASLDLGAETEENRRSLLAILQRARLETRLLPPDPFITPLAEGSSCHDHDGSLPGMAEVLDTLEATAGEHDFAGLYAGGPQVMASVNSRGMNHWFSTNSHFVNYSLFTRNASGENKAVKGLHAGRYWNPVSLQEELVASQSRLGLLTRDSHAVLPGRYRVFLAPAAVDALLGMFSWGAVSFGAWRRGESALKALIEGEVSLSPHFSLHENFGLGLSPVFNSQGELSPERLPVIESGQFRNLLVSSRSSAEYGVPANGAEPDGAAEALRSPEILPGDLPETDILSRLGTGLYIGNLHYLNWSDLRTARLTGMTRYACFWVEKGEIVAPIQDLRFDESLYHIFGAGLEAVTSSSHIQMNTDTYGQRALGGSRCPGILVSDFRFTL